MESIQLDILTISGAILLIATFGIVARRGFMDWLNAYRHQSIVLAGVTAIIGYVAGIWEIYAVAAMTLVIKSFIIPKVLIYVTRKLEIEFKIETNPYVSIRVSVIISALLVALSYFLTQQTPLKSDQIVNAYLPVSIAQFFIGLFVLVNRRTVLSQVVGLLIIENGLFLFTMALTHGVSLLIEIGIFIDILVGIIISSILLFRISRTFDSLDVGKLENLRDD
ncbi:MAG TPA: NADH-quinone oxidoreductase subunit K [Candidatus Nitrosotenuis sp.]|jgi:hydrogenase-4 component E|nr:NADH-quinone oxidoreductase subunit K [Candidatus Nitrosotenuis sp.]